MRKKILKIQGNVKIKEIQITYDENKFEMEFIFLGDDLIYFESGQFKVDSTAKGLKLKSTRSFITSKEHEAPVVSKHLNPGELYTMEVEKEDGTVVYIGLGSVEGEALKNWFATYDGKPYPKKRKFKNFRSSSRYLTIRTSKGFQKTTIIYMASEKRRKMIERSANLLFGLNPYKLRKTRISTRKNLTYILNQKKNNPYFGLNDEERTKKFLESWDF